MFVKYIMQNEQDYRGWVKLIATTVQGDIAYSDVEVVENDMVLLTPAEITLVKTTTDGQWISIKESLIRRIDDKADIVRKSFKLAGADTIDLEYHQVEDRLNRWIANGSDLKDIPDEVVVWAEVNAQDIEWAISDIQAAMLLYRDSIKIIRRLRLEAKQFIIAAEPGYAKPVYDVYSRILDDLLEASIARLTQTDQ